jgi:hypothetical protein
MVVKRCLLVLAVMGLTFLFTPTAHPASKYAIESLRGLTGVNVLVEDLPTEIKKELPFDENQISVDVELKLRMAGIKVLSEEERIKTPGMPYLYVNQYIKRLLNMPIFYFHIKIGLKQMVYLERNPNISSIGTTWETGTTGFVGEDVVSKIRDIIKDYLDIFINDYLSVNP